MGILLLCTAAGFLLAQVFMSSEGAVAGASKGLFVGLLVAWGEWKAAHANGAEEKGIGVH